jgi:hypothetical protein
MDLPFLNIFNNEFTAEFCLFSSGELKKLFTGN